MRRSRSEPLYRSLVELSGMGIVLLDLEGRRTYANDRILEMSGRSRDDLLTGRFGDGMVPEDRERALKAFQRCIATEEPVTGFVSRSIRNGEAIFISGNWAPLRDVSGRIVGVQVTSMDITDLVRAQEALRRSEELYRTLVESVGCMVVRVDAEGRRTFANEQTAQFAGVSREEVLRGHFGHGTHPEDRPRVQELLRETFRTGQPRYGVSTRQMVHGEVRYTSSNWVPIKDAEGNVVEVQITSQDVTESSRRQEQSDLYGAMVRRAQEEERLRMSQFLHDDTIQGLLAATHSIQAVLAEQEGMGARNAAKLEQTHQLLLDQIEALRRLSLSMRPPVLDRMGLDAAIRWFVRQACQHSGVQGEVQVGKRWRRLPPAVEVRLFRIVQEAVNNAIRHGQPRKVCVRLDIVGDWLEVTVEDDGQGFALPNSHIDLLQRGQLGLTGMQERARELGAELQVVSGPGMGCRILLRGRIDRAEQAA